jgi:hypothetical protein
VDSELKKLQMRISTHVYNEFEGIEDSQFDIDDVAFGFLDFLFENKDLVISVLQQKDSIN